MLKIYQPKGRAREYSPFALNHFSGCNHGCLYCYVPRMMSSIGNKNNMYNHENVFCKDLTGLENEIKRFKKSNNRNEQVLLSFTTDPYNPVENGETRTIIKLFVEHGIHFNILTKNPVKALRDLDLLVDYKYCKIGITLTCLSHENCMKFEPNAPDSMERIHAMKQFCLAGVKTWVSFEPVIFFEDTIRMIEMSSKFAHDIKIGKLNNCYAVSSQVPDINWAYFAQQAAATADKFGIPFYIKEDLRRYIHNDDLNKFMWIRKNMDSFNA